MTTAPASVEANLLFPAFPGRDLDPLVPELKRCAERLGAPVERTRMQKGDYLLLEAGPLQIVLTFCPVPFEVSDFEGTSRPNTDGEKAARALAKLEAHQASLTVLVSDRRDAGGGRTPHAPKARLCWDISDLLAEALRADLVFWSETDTLYTAGEFARESLGTTPRAARRTARRTSGTAPGGEETAGAQSFLDILAAAASGSRKTAAAGSTCRAWERVSRGLPASELYEIDIDPEEDEILTPGVVEKGTTYGLLALLMAINFPVAAGAAFYNIVRGENAHAVAQIISITALGTAIAWASLAEKAFAFL